MHRRASLLITVLIALAAPAAVAQEVSFAVGPSDIGDGPLLGDEFTDRAVALCVHAALLPDAVFTPTASVHYAAFSRSEPSGSVSLVGVALGARLQPVRSGWVAPFARAGFGVGRRTITGHRTAEAPDGGGRSAYSTLVANGAVGVRVGPPRGPFASVEVEGVVGSEGISATGYYGLHLGAGYRF